MSKSRIFIGRFLFWLAWLPQFIGFKFQKRTRILLEVNDEILVVKGWMSEGKYSLPGGGLRSGEKPQRGALRELKEETGVELKESDLVKWGLKTQNMHALKFDYYLFFAKLSKKPKTIEHNSEIVEVSWKYPNSLSSENSEPNVIDAIAKWQAKQ